MHLFRLTSVYKNIFKIRVRYHTILLLFKIFRKQFMHLQMYLSLTQLCFLREITKKELAKKGLIIEKRVELIGTYYFQTAYQRKKRTFLE